MSLGLIVFGSIIFIPLLIVLITGNFNKLMALLGGRTSLVFKHMAKTPKGLEAIYEKAIEDAQKQNREAKDILQKLSGALISSKRNLEDSQNRLAVLDSKCRRLMAEGKEKEARIIAIDVNNTKKLIQNYERRIADLEPKVETAKKIQNKSESELIRLKQERQIKLEELRLSIQNKKMYDSMDKLNSDKAINKLLESVDEEIEKVKESSLGAEAVYNNSLEAKKDEIFKGNEEDEIDAYLKSISNTTAEKHI